jgi:hypothetical protein
MEKPFNLSDHIIEDTRSSFPINHIQIQWVKEFIKKLKLELFNLNYGNIKNETAIKGAYLIMEENEFRVIDNLAGEKLR